MSDNRKSMNRKFTGKKMGILAAAALTATMIGGNVQVVTQPVHAAEAQETAAVLPDNITIDQPTELANIGLPVSEYGTLEWADGSYVPTQRVQSCEVILTPGEGQDLSRADGWDPEAGVVVGHINVIVNGIEDSSADTAEAETPAENPDVTGTPDNAYEDSKKEADKDNSTDKNGKIDDQSTDKDKSANSAHDKNSEAGDKKTDTADLVGKLEPADEADQDADKSDDENSSDSSNGEDDNIFDNPVLPDQKDDRPTDADDGLTDAEKEERAEINHTCDGITVSGVSLPWYVQFRVSSGDSYQFTNESDAMIFQSYEFELWDLQNNTEYEIPSGEYISVTVPVKAGYQYTIEHLLDNGATETIIPSVDNDVMVFSTHSFSPFGIAGSRQLVGPDTSDDSESTDTVTPTPAADSAQKATTDSGNSNTVSMNENSDNSNSNNGGSSSSAQTDGSAENETAKNNGAVNTGDTTTILPFVVLVVAAAVIIGAVVFIKKRKK